MLRCLTCYPILPSSPSPIPVMNDLLYAFMGQGGTYVRAKMVPSASSPEGDGAAEGGMPSLALTFVVEGDLDPSLLEMVERLLPIW